MDSQLIAAALEKFKPDSSLHLALIDHAKIAQIAVQEIMVPISGIWILILPPQILRPASAQCFKEDREHRLGGVSLEEFGKQHGGENAWEAAEPGMKRLVVEGPIHASL